MLTSPSLGFSRAREPHPYPGVAEPYLEPLPQKSRKNPGPEKRQFLVYLNIKKFNCFVAGAPEHFCWILGRLGFDSFLKGSTPILSQAKSEKNVSFKGRSRSRTLFFSRENEKNANFEGRSHSRTLFFSRETEKNMNFNDC